MDRYLQNVLKFTIDGSAISFALEEMSKDGSCLFRSISYILYGSPVHHQTVRENIVRHVEENWHTFHPLTFAPDGNNYSSKDEYISNMIFVETFGSYCELVAASELFSLRFEIYQENGSLMKVGDSNNPNIGRLYFTGNLNSGHFDVLKPFFDVSSNSRSVYESSFPPLVSECSNLNPPAKKKKRRSRVTDNIRRSQIKEAKANYSKRNPQVNQKAVKKYADRNPQVHQKAVKKYTELNPEVNQKAVKKYTELNPEVNQNAVNKYSEKFPEVHKSSALKYQKENPEKHSESVKRYAERNPEQRAVSVQNCSEKRRVEKALELQEKSFSGFIYDYRIDYAASKVMSLGKMHHICKWCKAFKWEDESSGMCCKNGKVFLPTSKQLPEPLLSLINGSHSESEHFLTSVRKYNACFQMTSFGSTKVDLGNFQSTFKVQGQVYHKIGSFYPLPQKSPCFLQIYFVGDELLEKDLRSNICSGVKEDLILDLQRMLHISNSYVRDFKAVIDSVPPDSDFKVVIRADRKPAGGHIGVYNEPSVGEVAAVIVGESFEPRDIVLHKKDHQLLEISEIHKGYDSLQYPLMFCYGENGYSINIPQINPFTKEAQRKTVSCKSFYAFKLMTRNNGENYTLYYRNLFNQFLVDMYAKVESERLRFIRSNQKKLRVEEYIHLQDAINKKDSSLEQVGKLCILPSSFIGGPRYMHERTQDAMTYVRHYGKPDFFITFTCNPKWTEIKDNLLPHQQPHHRHDIIARVFQLKVSKFMSLLTKSNIFGEVRCHVYSIEWQKRGLPHVHVLIWLVNKINPNDIDKIISAEIPDPKEDPKLYEIVKSNMIHGPCGALNPKSPCMKGNSCSKHYPRALITETQTGNDGYPLYRRRSREEGGHTVTINGIELDNRWVVPHSPVLLRSLESHVNAELCMSVQSIKYILKYINKGSDQAAFTIQNEFDEITRYETGRYISSSEAAWRLFGFSIHDRYPAVVQLAVHLENGQRVYFDPVKTPVDQIIKPKSSTLMGFFDLCKIDNFAKTLFYYEVPQYYTWQHNKFNRRSQGEKVPSYPGVVKSGCLGRVYTVHPSNAECYFLRMLLHKIKGPTSFADLRTVDGITHKDFRSACLAMGLLEDDKHWNEALNESAVSDSPKKIRELFAIIITFCNVSNPVELWQNHKNNLCEDVKRKYQLKGADINLEHICESIENEGLILLKDLIAGMTGKSLSSYGLPEPHDRQDESVNVDYIRETSYDMNILSNNISENEPLLNSDQKVVYEQVLNSINNEKGKTFFLDAPGGTGKTFLINLLLSKVRRAGSIAIAVASSGIAATLLDGGRTAHSTFKLPLNMTQSNSVSCNISKQSNMAIVLRDCKLIIWDESTMSHKAGIEAVDSLLRDVKDSGKLFGGVTVLFAGDFRQTLPVVPRGTRSDEIRSCLKKSYLWRFITVLKLKTNMRVHLKNQENADGFADLLLQVGNGTATENDGRINVSDLLCVGLTNIDEFLTRIYCDLKNIDKKPFTWLKERAILTPKNTTVHAINSTIIDHFDSRGVTYLSIDTVIEEDDAVRYPVEFLNSLNPSGMPLHNLVLKIGVPIMLLRNLKPPKLCNGTRLRVINLSLNIIEATIMTGCGEGESVFIPRIPLISSDYAFEFKRLQFPIKPCFAMTINKSQGQSLKMVGVDLREDCFSHGQLYVAISRVSSPDDLVILQPEGKTRNIVYKEVLGDF